ncbi:MAG: bifunctional diaminohydroxyphosphoribosylaminopyrimidine deaminase/5-amino-6-(5-phosphoribosylamino)uracil reductase RibD [Rhodospirillum sp.]|nr:bifunctional diaminohydroxyphosphoribosylaminopyrimidine deaminase/5-amino-6-(5-phosphoribosylamino)uracil reductase RibD [Rhodospirillum sp.]MCF8487760.1 bifunctional diaminohydroxyphosphoribosylaminopyrimidine deaminase/5-amino-6-(5-phosphoribosylamino)uracil reductase RibD [Rhodospirillum sp.]MCF8501113.1 bifunctional diaminohydroxyphosphoribosylaminopyrimidine deaminase/5-amino-6-(5-phosphoribosylamino)uracil reductase RibD [Rhodospirillum sp.]
MDVALGLAARGLGRVWPNPSVGCVLVSADGRVVGRGWTQPGGRPHAEREALDRAGPLARGATAHVTLEPCNHHGKTPPCAEALINAGVSRVVVALSDPDKRVSGRGLARLKEAGIQVRVGVREGEAKALNLGFLLHRIKGRPLVTLKVATSLDGRIATATGHSQWITGPAAREQGHRLRATHDAIAVGIGTALADDPTLTCRLPGLEDRSPVRVVFDSRARLPLDGALIRSADQVPLWIVTGPETSVDRGAALEERGVLVLSVAGDGAGRPRVEAALSALAERGITRLLVEGGGDLAGAFLAARLVDRLVWFRAPMVIGGDGKGAIAAFGVDRLADSAQFSARARFDAGVDLVERFDASDPLFAVDLSLGISLSETE